MLQNDGKSSQTLIVIDIMGLSSSLPIHSYLGFIASILCLVAQSEGHLAPRTVDLVATPVVKNDIRTLTTWFPKPYPAGCGANCISCMDSWSSDLFINITKTVVITDEYGFGSTLERPTGFYSKLQRFCSAAMTCASSIDNLEGWQEMNSWWLGACERPDLPVLRLPYPHASTLYPACAVPTSAASLNSCLNLVYPENKYICSCLYLWDTNSACSSNLVDSVFFDQWWQVQCATTQIPRPCDALSYDGYRYNTLYLFETVPCMSVYDYMFPAGPGSIVTAPYNGFNYESTSTSERFDPSQTSARVANNAVQHFETLFNDGRSVPACSSDIQTICPELYDILEAGLLNLALNNITTLQTTTAICGSIIATSCSTICLDGGGSYGWSKYVLDHCKAAFPNIETDWADYASYRKRAAEDYQRLFPWNWTVSYNPTFDGRNESSISRGSEERFSPPQCASLVGKIVPFVASEIAVLAMTLILGRRDVLYFTSCGYLGDPQGGPWWPVTAALFTGLSIGSNFIAASIVARTPGYQGVPFGELVLLWNSRPRIAWVAGLFMLVQKHKAIYFGTGASAMFSEFVLQIVGSVYLGRTVQHARVNGFYTPRTLDTYQSGRSALLMYIGALFWLVFVGSVFLMIAWSFLGLGALVKKLFRWTSAQAARPGEAIAETGRNFEADLRARARLRVGTSFAPFAPLATRLVKQQIAMLPPQMRQQPGYITETGEIYNVAAYDTDSNPAFHDRNYATYNRRNIALPSAIPHWQMVLFNMGLSKSAAISIQWVVVWMAMPFVGQWLFWYGYISLAGDLYCPPNQGYLTAAWSGVGIIGILFGA